MGSAQPKQYRQVGGRALVARCAEAFLNYPGIDAVRIVIHPDDGDRYQAATKGLDLLDPVTGGTSRQDSVLRGLESLVEIDPDKVLIHDAARPSVPAELIDRVLAALDVSRAVIPGIPLTDSVKRARDGVVSESVDREGLWRVQTPQGFRFGDILAAHRALAGRALSDDAAVAEAAGVSVAVVPGSDDNFKVTESADLVRAERMLSGHLRTRLGSGFDVHRFGPGNQVTLCGVKVPHEQGLRGHSDADVGLHALVDAVFGALGGGDLGSHFPSGDDAWRGTPSTVFAHRARELVASAGGVIVHLDLTLVCQRPKIAAYREEMIAAVARAFDIAPRQVSVKATTTDGLGFAGRGEGIAALAAATLRLPD